MEHKIPSIRFQSDAQLLRDCRLDITRGSGPGGQKRNKTSNLIRLTHLPTKLHVVAGESRSQLENKTRAIRRMKLKLAIEIREPIALMFEPPDWFLTIRRHGKIEASHRHEFYSAAAGLILDLFESTHGSPSDVGVLLGVATTSIVRFLEEEPSLWTAANKIRSGWKLPPLTHRK